jgi:signal transduction histidine kinase
MTVTPQACDLRDTVESAVRLLRRQADHAGVVMEIAGAARVQADPARLRQLLINLVLNAIQAQHGGGAVRIAINPDGLTVSDDGPGIDPALRSHLFEAFASARPGGTGLGLHLAKTIADAHGAKLELAPSERGTCFRLSGLAAAR